MEELIHTFTTEVTDLDGHPYRARAMGRGRSDGTWVGWIEFMPKGGGIVRETGTETTQPSRETLAYWASGLEPVYLEGALVRAIARSAMGASRKTTES